MADIMNMDRELIKRCVLDIDRYLKEQSASNDILNSFNIIKKAIVMLDNSRLNYNICSGPSANFNSSPLTFDSLSCSHSTKMGYGITNGSSSLVTSDCNPFMTFVNSIMCGAFFSSNDNKTGAPFVCYPIKCCSSSILSNREALYEENLTSALSGTDLDSKTLLTVNHPSISPEALSPNQICNKSGWTIGKSRRVKTFNDEDYDMYMAQLGRNWNLDLLALSNMTKVKADGPIYCMGSVLLRDVGERIHPEFNKLILPVLRSLQDMYLPNPYHNALHGATVGHMSVLLARCIGGSKRFKQFDEFAFIMAALGHDAGHPGKTNSFLSSTGNPLAIIYNDNSILENYHASLMFHIIRSHDTFFRLFSQKDWERMRRLIIQLVLSTDMKTHFTHISNVKERRLVGEFNHDENEDDFWLLLVLCIKVGDVGHNFLPWVDHLPWAQVLFEEFYLQGDEERLLSMPLLQFFDRTKATDVPDSQLGFFEAFTKPMIEELSLFDETKSKYIERVLIANAIKNLECWKKSTSKKIQDILEELDPSLPEYAIEDEFVDDDEIA